MPGLINQSWVRTDCILFVPGSLWTWPVISLVEGQVVGKGGTGERQYLRAAIEEDGCGKLPASTIRIAIGSGVLEAEKDVVLVLEVTGCCARPVGRHF